MSLVEEFSEWRARVVELTREHRVLLRCPVRQRDFIDGPEERIRQALLHFFVDVARDLGLVLGAERERHDIDLRWPSTDVFRPTAPPLLIVETKRDEVAGEWTNQQLARYLGETAGDCGVVFTGRRMWRLDITPAGLQPIAMSSLSELAALVRDRAVLYPFTAERAHFEAARGGDQAALRRLVARFPYATFVLTINGRDTPCRHVRFTADAIEYRPADQYARQPSRVTQAAVTRLVSIES